VDRIQSVTLTGERFETPESFDIKEFLQDSFGIFQGAPVAVKIRFAPSVAGYIRERVWHHSQKLLDAEDGALIFTATVAGVEEISHWVMRWGAGAQVLAPPELRRTVSRHAAAMAAYYCDDPDVDQPPES
jgi:predicted DNA-binding transcriptional regulator YafY